MKIDRSAWYCEQRVGSIGQSFPNYTVAPTIGIGGLVSASSFQRRTDYVSLGRGIQFLGSSHQPECFCHFRPLPRVSTNARLTAFQQITRRSRHCSDCRDGQHIDAVTAGAHDMGRQRLDLRQ